MKKYTLSILCCSLLVSWINFGCKVPASTQVPALKTSPISYNSSSDTNNTAFIKWNDFFQDKYLLQLIDTAVHNNLEVLTALQEIEVAKNKIRARKGLLLPTVSGVGGIGLDKTARYTSTGAGNASTDITPGVRVPEQLGDYMLGFQASWEVDVWGKLHNYKRAALARYLESMEGKNFVVTSLVAEIASSYYELIALDNQLDIIREAISIQKNALELVKVQKDASRVTELAVKQFEATVLHSQSMEFDILQQITENENKINYLLGRYPQPVLRDKRALTDQLPIPIRYGIPSQMLINRPDIRKAEQELAAAKCDVKAARAEFYPSFGITGGVGFQAFKPNYLFLTPESFMYSLMGDLTAPLINRNGIRAEFNTANAYQLEAMYDYQKTIINGYVEVSNEVSSINNLEKLYNIKSKEVDALKNSIEISNDLFKSAKADYLEVLTAQRDALDSKLELVETRKRQFSAITNLYRALGGGWR